MTDRNRNRTPEDEMVTRALDALPGLKEYADGAELRLAMGADTDLIAEYGRDIVPLEEFEGTDWHAHVQTVREWAESEGFVVSVDSEMGAADLPHAGRAIVNASLGEWSPLYMNVFCEADGRVEVKIQVEPFERHEEVYDGAVSDLDVEAVREAVDGYRPFVTGRVRELMHQCGVKPSRARAVALREVGFTHKEVGERLDITKGASGSFQSKFNSGVADSEHLFVARTPVPRRVLAKRTFERTNYLDERWYVCEEIRPTEEQTDSPITVTIIKGDHTPEGVDLNVSTTGFPSLRACIDSLYASQSFPDEIEAEERRKLFEGLPTMRRVEADYEELPPVGDVLHAELP